VIRISRSKQGGIQLGELIFCYWRLHISQCEHIGRPLLTGRSSDPYSLCLPREIAAAATLFHWGQSAYACPPSRADQARRAGLRLSLSPLWNLRNLRTKNPLPGNISVGSQLDYPFVGKGIPSLLIAPAIKLASALSTDPCTASPSSL
jgi:hypothetical protein